MDRDEVDAVVIEPGQPANASVIWLHGLGADGHDFVPLARLLPPGVRERTRFIFPHAPIRPVTLNLGLPIRAWYDIAGLNREAPEDHSGIQAATAFVHALIQQQQHAGIAAERIILAGFSQGAALAVHAATRLPQRLAGLLALSGYLIRPNELRFEATRESRQTPIALHHGRYDPILPPTLGEELRDRLTELGYTPRWRLWDMAHEVCDEQIDVIGTWLQEQLLPQMRDSA